MKSIRTRLGILFFITGAVIIIGFSLFWISFENRSRLQSISLKRQEDTHTVHIALEACDSLYHFMHNYGNYNSSERQEKWAQLKQIANEAINKTKTFTDTDEERSAVSSAVNNLNEWINLYENKYLNNPNVTANATITNTPDRQALDTHYQKIKDSLELCSLFLHEESKLAADELKESNKTERQIRLLTILGLMLLFFLLFLTAYRIVISPIQKITRWANLHQKGDLNAKIEWNGSDEFGNAINELNAMADIFSKQFKDKDKIQNNLQTLINSLGEAVVVLDNNQRIKNANLTAANLFGDEIAGKIFSQAIQLYRKNQKEPITNPLQPAIVQLIKTEFIFFVLDKDDNAIDVLLNLTPLNLSNPDENDFVLVIKDISAIVEREKILVETNRRLTTLSECNQALVRHENINDLTAEMSQILVNYGGYAYAKISLLSNDQLISVAEHYQRGFSFNHYEETLDPNFVLNTRSGSHVGIQLLLPKENAEEDTSGKHEIKLFTAPIEIRDLPLGILTVIKTNNEIDDENDIKLLDELAHDIGFGVNAIMEEQALRLAEISLEESNELLQKTFSSLNESVLILNPHIGRIIENCNERFTDIFGWTKEEALGKDTLMLHIDQSAYDKLAEIALIDFDKQGYCDIEYNFIRKNGEIFPATVFVRPIFDKMNKLWRLVVVIQDITESKKSELELIALKEFYEFILENVHEGVIYTDKNDDIIYHNIGYKKIFDAENEKDVIGLNVIKDFSNERTKNIITSYIEAKTNLNPVKLHPSKYITLKEEEIYITGWFVPIVHENQYDGIILTLQNITDTVKKELELNESNLRYTSLFQDNHIVIILADPITGNIIDVNPAACKFYKYSLEKLTSMKVWEINTLSKDEMLSRLQNAATGDWRSNEFKHRIGDGTICDVEISVGRITVDNRELIYGIVHDISERKKAEASIQNQINRLEALRTIDNAISATMDVRVSLNVLLNQTAMQLGADAASVMLFDPDIQELKCVAERGFITTDYIFRTIRAGENISGQCVIDRKHHSLSNISKSSANSPFEKFCVSEGIAAYYAAPLQSKGYVKGVIELFFRKPFHPDNEWINFFDTLCGQAAIAIDNSELFLTLQRSNTELAMAYDTTLEGWSKALDLRDKDTEGHTLRVTDITVKLANIMGLSKSEQVQIRRGALLHDIGKMGISDSILLKDGMLTEEEWVIMRKHPVYAYHWLSPIAYLKPALDIPYCHHERWDGKGYPRGLREEEIPLHARIFAVVDVWDAMKSDRPYRKGLSEKAVRNFILKNSGVMFDPKVVDAYMSMLDSEDYKQTFFDFASSEE